LQLISSKVPLPLLVNLTFPEGLLPSAAVTEAAQVASWPSTTVEGAHETDALVGIISEPVAVTVVVDVTVVVAVEVTVAGVGTAVRVVVSVVVLVVVVGDTDVSVVVTVIVVGGGGGHRRRGYGGGAVDGGCLSHSESRGRRGG